MARKTARKIKLITDYHQLRTELQMSQSEFWGRIGVTQSCGSRYERGRQPPKPTAILAHHVYILGQNIDAKDYQ